MLGNPNADNPFATSDPFGPSRAAPASDDFDNVNLDSGNNAPTSSGLYGGPTNGADLLMSSFCMLLHGNTPRNRPKPLICQCCSDRCRFLLVGRTFFCLRQLKPAAAACRWYRCVCAGCSPEKGDCWFFASFCYLPQQRLQHCIHPNLKCCSQAKANRTTKDLEKRERELDKREKALAAREAKLAQSGTRVAGVDVSVSFQPTNIPAPRKHTIITSSRHLCAV